jgi:hypothetical protein
MAPGNRRVEDRPSSRRSDNRSAAPRVHLRIVGAIQPASSSAVLLDHAPRNRSTAALSPYSFSRRSQPTESPPLPHTPPRAPGHPNAAGLLAQVRTPIGPPPLLHRCNSSRVCSTGLAGGKAMPAAFYSAGPSASLGLRGAGHETSPHEQAYEHQHTRREGLGSGTQTP